MTSHIDLQQFCSTSKYRPNTQSGLLMPMRSKAAEHLGDIEKMKGKAP